MLTGARLVWILSFLNSLAPQLIIDIFGPPIAKNMSAMLGLIIGMIVAGGIGYFDKSAFSSAPVITFLWVHRFPLSVRGELVLPFIASYLVVISEVSFRASQLRCFADSPPTASMM